MKVLHVFKDYYPPTVGGIELHINDIVHSMEGVEFEVLTSARSRRHVEDMDGAVRVVRTPEYARPTSTPVTPAWIGHLRRTDADLVHFHVPNPFGELAVLASRTPAPIVASYHSDIVGRRWALPFYLPLQRRMLAKARAIIVGSPPMRRAAQVAPFIDQTVIVPYGIDPEPWRPRPSGADAIRDRHEPPIVVCLGRLAYYKGLDVLLQAMRGIEGTLILVGSGPLRPNLEAQARGSRVVFAGEVKQEDRAAYLHAADVFVLASTMRAEAFGIAMLQAMACGTPVVSTELGTGTSWLNVDGETGLVVPPNDAAALAAALRSLLGDPPRARDMGQAAMRRVSEKFTKHAMIEVLTQVYGSAVGS